MQNINTRTRSKFMGIYRTAQGKRLDMSTLARKNERVRAVGNMSVNARGDTIDSAGRVIVPVTKKVGAKYERTVSNRAARLAKRKEDLMQPIEASVGPEKKLDIAEEIELFQDIPDIESDFELLEEEQEIDDLAEFEVEIEEIKAKEVEKSKKK